MIAIHFVRKTNLKTESMKATYSYLYSDSAFAFLLKSYQF